MYLKQSPASVQLVLNNVSPPGTAGALNGVALTLNALVRAVTTEASTSLFAYGVKRNLLGRYLPWVILIVLSVVGFGLSAMVPKDEAGSRGNEDNSDADDRLPLAGEME